MREVLGLVTDEAYAELLELVAARNPAAVFPLLDRLVDSGADLIEFIAGAAEALRAVLLTQLGGDPEGITEGMRHAVAAVRDRLPAGDLLRMLKLFAEGEPSIRRSGTPRLVVETMLLRWALMDRTVDLEAVIRGGQGGQGDQGGQANGAGRAIRAVDGVPQETCATRYLLCPGPGPRSRPPQPLRPPRPPRLPYLPCPPSSLWPVSPTPGPT